MQFCSTQTGDFFIVPDTVSSSSSPSEDPFAAKAESYDSIENLGPSSPFDDGVFGFGSTHTLSEDFLSSLEHGSTISATEAIGYGDDFAMDEDDDQTEALQRQLQAADVILKAAVGGKRKTTRQGAQEADSDQQPVARKLGRRPKKVDEAERLKSKMLRREKNNLAAQKCRAKKRAEIQVTEERAQQLALERLALLEALENECTRNTEMASLIKEQSAPPTDSVPRAEYEQLQEENRKLRELVAQLERQQQEMTEASKEKKKSADFEERIADLGHQLEKARKKSMKLKEEVKSLGEKNRQSYSPKVQGHKHKKTESPSPEKIKAAPAPTALTPPEDANEDDGYMEQEF